MYSNLTGKTVDPSNDIAAEPKKLLKRLGLFALTTRNFIFRIRSGHNFYTIRFEEESVLPHSNKMDGVIALKNGTEKLYREKLEANGFILGVNKLPVDDPRVIRLGMEEMAMAAQLQKIPRV